MKKVKKQFDIYEPKWKIWIESYKEYCFRNLLMPRVFLENKPEPRVLNLKTINIVERVYLCDDNTKMDEIKIWTK